MKNIVKVLKFFSLGVTLSLVTLLFAGIGTELMGAQIILLVMFILLLATFAYIETILKEKSITGIVSQGKNKSSGIVFPIILLILSPLLIIVGMALFGDVLIKFGF